MPNTHIEVQTQQFTLLNTKLFKLKLKKTRRRVNFQITLHHQSSKAQSNHHRLHSPEPPPTAALQDTEYHKTSYTTHTPSAPPTASAPHSLPSVQLLQLSSSSSRFLSPNADP
ncbi:hypothetical protein HanPSC8_Chr06g0234821 [Helianthus annuus]|nr:hypothetical protein HanPSC8_Chr06g0234821 [Helianthus annuus]